MKTHLFLAALTTTLLAGVALPAAAQQKLLPAQSELSFAAKQMGVPVSGHFKKFDAQVSFDATKLASSKVTFTVDMGSATMGSAEADSELPKAPWFNAPKFPQATFTSSAFKALGAGKYELAGKLSIKGQARDVLVSLSMTQSGAVTVASGVLPIKRLAFSIGDGDWADTSMVADEVQVKFKFALSGVGKL
ncbi:MAG: YceI family protein [Rhodoferax sp.]|uniref:YceI family protein n=1 Tax=Rhodoferax sp. TaxID=50421 RepID=UPI00263061A2|nr:YceI family protein [Rhodoferax sp.]MDD2882754.1 YceI family protein [Rhodoferax sp.]